jgi:transcriptional/translational regulatory protein YebC/TACO1
VFKLKPEGINLEDLELELIDFGLEELGEDSEGNVIVRCEFNDFRQHAKGPGRARL